MYSYSLIPPFFLLLLEINTGAGVLDFIHDKQYYTIYPHTYVLSQYRKRFHNQKLMSHTY